MKLAIIRHGKPEIDYKEKICHRNFHEWLERYDKAEIDTKVAAPKILLDTVKDSSLFVCSDLKRSVSSFKALNVDKIPIIDRRFRECEIPFSTRGNFNCRADILTIFYRILWLYGLSANCESKSAAISRANICVDELIRLANEHHFVTFIGHGFLNRFIASTLLKRGWSGSKQPGRSHWACDIYELKN